MSVGRSYKTWVGCGALAYGVFQSWTLSPAAADFDPMVVLQQLGCKYDQSQQLLRCPNTIKSERQILDRFFAATGSSEQRRQLVVYSDETKSDPEPRERSVNVRNIFQVPDTKDNEN